MLRPSQERRPPAVPEADDAVPPFHHASNAAGASVRAQPHCAISLASAALIGNTARRSGADPYISDEKGNQLYTLIRD